MSLRERLAELAETASLYTYNKGRVGTKEELALAAARMALEEAARECEKPELSCCGHWQSDENTLDGIACCGEPEQQPRDDKECAKAIRALAQGLE